MIQCSAEEHRHDRAMDLDGSGLLILVIYSAQSEKKKQTNYDKFSLYLCLCSNYEDFSRDSFDDRRPPRDSFDLDRRPGMRGQSPTYLRYAPY